MFSMTRGAIFGKLLPLNGFHDIESDIWGPFVWTRKRFSIRRQSAEDCCAFKMCYGGDRGTLSYGTNNGERKQLTLCKGWNTYPLSLTEADGEDVEFEISEVPPVEGDPRELGLMIRSVTPLEDRGIASELEPILANKVKNEREYRDGATVLESLPSKLRINTAVQCTMNPQCAYCDWDRTKQDELDSGFKFSTEKLYELGDFYRLSEEIVDNSYGEPFAHPRFGNYLEEFHRHHKYFEVGSNGHLLNPENRSRVLGKDVVIYVSADAADAKTYARYRNDKFDLLIDNLRSLCQERTEHRLLPKIIMSFVVMRSNRDQVLPFLDLMKDVGVDGTKLIYLDPDPHLQQLVLNRNGFRFDYNAELLSLSELDQVYEEAKRAAAEKSVHAINRLDFGAEEAGGHGPICSEPWKNVHVLDRGVVVCLFSRTAPLALWSDRGNRSIERFLLDVWNGERYKEIRASLSRGEFPDLCKKSLSCPLVRRRFEKPA